MLRRALTSSQCGWRSELAVFETNSCSGIATDGFSPPSWLFLVLDAQCTTEQLLELSRCHEARHGRNIRRKGEVAFCWIRNRSHEFLASARGRSISTTEESREALARYKNASCIHSAIA